MVDANLTLADSLLEESVPSRARCSSGKALTCLSFVIGLCFAAFLKPVSQPLELHEPAIGMANLVQQRPGTLFQQSFSQQSLSQPALRTAHVAFAVAEDKKTKRLERVAKFGPNIRPMAPKIEVVSANPINYVSFYEYKVRPGSGPGFEQRFAARKTQLFQLRGFQQFIVLRRKEAAVPTLEGFEGADNFTYCVMTSFRERVFHDAWLKGPDYMRKAFAKGLMMGEAHPTESDWFAKSYYAKEQPAVRYLEGGPGSKMDFAGDKELDTEVFVSMRKYPDFESDDKLRGEAESISSAKGFRYAQVLENPTGKSDVKQVLLSVWDSQAEYEASVLAKSGKPPMGESLYEGVLSLEQPQNF